MPLASQTADLSDPVRFAILASGSGTNADALMAAFAQSRISGELAVVVTNNPNAGVIAKAKARQAPLEVVPSKGLERAQHEEAVTRQLNSYGVQVILLAGYMRILSPGFVSQWSQRILNIHPSLLPDFPGLHAAERQWRAGRKIAGATVHLVDEGVDSGPPILMGSIRVRGDEGAEGLAQRILHEVEHVIYPQAVELYLERQRDTEVP